MTVSCHIIHLFPHFPTTYPLQSSFYIIFSMVHSLTLSVLCKVKGWSGICCLTQLKTSPFVHWLIASVT